MRSAERGVRGAECGVGRGNAEWGSAARLMSLSGRTWAEPLGGERGVRLGETSDLRGHEARHVVERTRERLRARIPAENGHRLDLVASPQRFEAAAHAQP